MQHFSLTARLLAVAAASAVLAACGGGARSTTTDKTTVTSRVTAPAMSEGRPAVAPSGEMQPMNGTPAQPIPRNLNCSATEIVWVNTKNHVYHYANDMYYGRTKQGTYMCERDAVAEHDRAAGARSSGSSSMKKSHKTRGGEYATPSAEATP
jgi:hypothetical protein